MVRIMMRIFSQLNAAIAYAEGDRATKLPEPHALEPRHLQQYHRVENDRKICIVGGDSPLLPAYDPGGLKMNHRVTRFVDWLQSVPTEPHFAELPEFAFFADLTGEELQAAEQELVRRLAVLGTDQDVRSAFMHHPVYSSIRGTNDV